MNEKRIWDCLVCGQSLIHHEDRCPRCGFYHLPYMGDREPVMEYQKPQADDYRSKKFLPRFDVGVIIYYWRDHNGTIVPDTTKRLSFGTAADLEDRGIVWLPQLFARVEEEEIPIRISIIQDGRDERILTFRLPALKEPQLQRVGLCMSKDLKLTVTVRNDTDSVSSAPCPLLPG